MRSPQGLEKVWREIKINNATVLNRHMEYIIGILLYKSFIDLQGPNQAFEEKQGHFKVPRQSSREKEHDTWCVAGKDLRKLWGNQKKTASLCEIEPHERHFCLFTLE